MTKSKLILILLIFQFSFSLYSQNQVRDILYLKDGSIIKGEIIEMIIAGNTKIKTQDGSLFVFKTEDIIKSEKEIKKETPTEIPNNNPQSIVVPSNQILIPIVSTELSKPFLSRTLNIGPILNESFDLSLPQIYINLIFARKLTKNYYLGAGPIVQTTENPMFGLVIDNNFIWYESFISPYVFAQGGYCFSVTSSFDRRNSRGGATYNGGVGAILKSKRNLKLAVSAGVNSQYNNYESINTVWNQKTHNYSYNYTQIHDNDLSLLLRVSLLYNFSPGY